MAAPVLDSFEWAKPENFYVRIGTAVSTATGTSGLLNQVINFKAITKAEKPKVTARRLGSATVEQYFKKAQYTTTVTFTVKAEEDAGDYMTATNDTTPADLDADTPVVVQGVLYSDAGVIKLVKTITGCYNMQDEFSIGDEAGTQEFELTSTAKIITQKY